MNINLDKKTLEVICDAMCERYKQTNDIARTGLTKSIRRAAEEDSEDTLKAWKIVEEALQKISGQK